MKVLIQNVQNQEYLAPRSGWTPDPTEADDFIVTTLAYNFARQMMAGPFRVLLHVPETNESIKFMDGVGRATTPGAI
ncbi:MAG: hypothetical protein JWQ04_2321 [Pedosphaera sp.]|nr:hypothetical protein [Pedosphaera sp.]